MPLSTNVTSQSNKLLMNQMQSKGFRLAKVVSRNAKIRPTFPSHQSQSISQPSTRRWIEKTVGHLNTQEPLSFLL